MERGPAGSQLKRQRKPSKSCMLCGATILWRRLLAANWDKVKYCSASCRRAAVAGERSSGNDSVEIHKSPNQSLVSAA